MRRFTITPEPRKSIRIPTSTIKPTAFPRMSVAAEDAGKSARNVKDKSYKQTCGENILEFLIKNSYEGQVGIKTLLNPSNKEFQNIYRFIHSFIDATVFTRFEEDVMTILRTLKYPYSGEITRSHLAAVTPHTWPAILSMMSWMVDLINKSFTDTEKAVTAEDEFLEYIYEGYGRFMDGDEEDGGLDERLMIRVASHHSRENEGNANLAKEVELLSAELENLKNKFTNVDSLRTRKNKLNEDLNTLISHERQLEAKRAKYVQAIEKLTEEISETERETGALIDTKNEILALIDSQTVHPEDVKGMNKEKLALLKELERLKPEKEAVMRRRQSLENSITDKIDENENLIAETEGMRNSLFTENSPELTSGFDYRLVTALEDELVHRKGDLVNMEIGIATIDEKIAERTACFKDLEEQWNQRNSKLKTIGSIYVEKKELSDRSQQKNRNEVDKLDNDLLKLKLENDSAFLKSERDYSETKIQLDILQSSISREREEIQKIIWDFYNTSSFMIKSLDAIKKDTQKSIAKQLQ